jgi:hypothetical protein
VVAAGARALGPEPSEPRELEVVEDSSPSPTPQPRPSRRPPPSPSPTPTFAEAAGAWSAGASAPVPGRQGTATVWTGREVLVFGGVVVDGEGGQELSADGAAYDPAADRWRALAPSPLAPRTDPAWAWTGAELIVWGGVGRDRLFDDGAAYDPATDRWRVLAPSPLSPRAAGSTVWMGDELLVLGGGDLTTALRDGAAYDPEADTWRPLATAPRDIGYPAPSMVYGPNREAAAVWAGRAVLLAAAFTSPSTPMLAYDPAGDRWSELPGLEGDGEVVEVVADGEDLLALELEYSSAFPRPSVHVLALGASAWVEADQGVPRLFEQASSTFFDPAARRLWVTDGYAATGRVAVFDLATRIWEVLPDRPPELRSAGDPASAFFDQSADLVWTGAELLLLEQRVPGELTVSRWRALP